MITSLALMSFFWLISVIDKITSVLPFVQTGSTFFSQLLIYVDSLVYLVRSAMPLTVTLLAQGFAFFFSMLYLFVFIRLIKFIMFFFPKKLGGTGEPLVFRSRKGPYSL